jgi:hypothetical protein
MPKTSIATVHIKLMVVENTGVMSPPFLFLRNFPVSAVQGVVGSQAGPSYEPTHPLFLAKIL